jgi:hypothetical protein
LSKLNKEIHQRYAEDSCSGPSGDAGAVCILNLQQSKCDSGSNSNLFNTAWNMGTYSPVIYVDRALTTEIECIVAGNRRWYDHTLNMSEPAPMRRGQQELHRHRNIRRHAARDRKRPWGNTLRDHDGSGFGFGSGFGYGYGYYGGPSFREQKLGCVCTGPSYDSSCHEVTLDWASMDTLQDEDGNPMVYNVPPLATEWLDNAPDTSQGQCRLVGFDAYSQYLLSGDIDLDGSMSRSEYLCTALGKTLVQVNGWEGEQLNQLTFDAKPIKGFFQAFSPTYDWEYDYDTSTYNRVQTGSGSQAWCEYDMTCNHKPWDPSAATQGACEDDYKSGGPNAAQGTEFCASCDGPFCWEISAPAKCLSSAWDQVSCEDSGGTWHDYECTIDNTPGLTEETCIDMNICPKEVYNYDQYSFTSYGFCEYVHACYKPDAQKDECLELGGQWYLDQEPQPPSAFGRRSGRKVTPVESLREVLGVPVSLGATAEKPSPQRSRGRRSRRSRGSRGRSKTAATMQDSMTHSRQATETCAFDNDDDWVDSYGDGCDVYEQDPTFCLYAESYADDEGNDATGKCCVCDWGSSYDTTCEDDEAWTDSFGDGCEAYAGSPDWCLSAGMYADEDGVDATSVCCICTALNASGIDFESIYGWGSGWWEDGSGSGVGDGSSCSNEVHCEEGLFCNFDEPGSPGTGWCEPCYGCSNCFACGLPDAGAEACAATCGSDSASNVTDSATCRFMSFSCDNITNGGWGTDALTVCDPTTSFYTCDGSGSGDVGLSAAQACALTCSRARGEGCRWVENNENTAGELYVGDAANEAECIQLVREECPSATIANMELDGVGSCWCQYGDDMSPSPGAGWKSCLLSSVGFEPQAGEPTDDVGQLVESVDTDSDRCISEGTAS